MQMLSTDAEASFVPLSHNMKSVDQCFNYEVISKMYLKIGQFLWLYFSADDLKIGTGIITVCRFQILYRKCDLSRLSH